MLNASNKDLAIKASALGIDLTNDGKIEAGIAQHYRAIRLDPENWRYKAFLAGSLVNEGRIQEAVPLVTACDQSDPFVSTIKAYMLLEDGKVKEALPYLKYAMDKDGRSGAAEFDYAFHTLLAGNLKEGWKHYECRRNYRVERTFENLARWNGSRVKTLLVWCEQGVGDCVQFARYIPWVATQADNVVFAVPNNLLAMFENYKKWVKIVPLSDIHSVKEADAEVALLSLPFFHGTTLDNVPKDPAIWNVGKAIGSLRVGNKVRVGIIWSGNPQQMRNKFRSMQFKDMIEVLGSHPNFELYSLQCGAASADISKNGCQSLITDLSGIIYGDWSATGGVLKELDVLVAPCTGAVHLAGALGVKAYLCLHNTPDWRWFMEREDNIWYDSVKLFRQKKRGDWKEVLHRVAADINENIYNKQSLAA